MGTDRGFTLLEVIMIVLLLGVLTAIVIPNLADFRSDARNAVTQGRLAVLRRAIASAHEGAPSYPTTSELIRILSSMNVPPNPWSETNGPPTNSIRECPPDRAATTGVGWCYNPTIGEIWANSKRNGLGTTENRF